ncbi:MAG: glycerol-3-phosphate 1-O-acyltransferase PlsY [Planctomycetes bacterium]|nr:glycerol-3-phosphate 1-O-acyltransferase PlsY [Planctomycetota bacterium]
MPWLAAFLTLLTAYLIGAIPFGFLIARMRGVNIFEHGSGNIGATNVGRILGKPLGFLVFVLDCTKGAIPVALASALAPLFTTDLWTRGYVEVAAGLTAFLGHLFPVYLKFRGGKGVATGLGAVSILLPLPTVIAFAVWAVVLCATRFMAVASIVAVLVLCATHLRLPSSWDWEEPRTWFCLIAGTLVIVKHRDNLGRLVRGTENQIKDSSLMQQLTKSLHMLALGLWFGSSVFFSFIVAFSLFGSFDALTQQKDRETWFPQPIMYRGTADDVDPVKEQGTRAAGFAIGPMFLAYFALQGACGFIALATALPMLKHEQESRVHRWRVNFLIIAVLLVLVGWPLERKVSALRIPRNESTEAYLLDRGDAAKRDEMKDARAEFGRWHLYSVLLNLATIVFVTGAMAMSGNLPSGAGADQPGAQATGRLRSQLVDGDEASGGKTPG